MDSSESSLSFSVRLSFLRIWCLSPEGLNNSQFLVLLAQNRLWWLKKLPWVSQPLLPQQPRGFGSGLRALAALLLPHSISIQGQHSRASWPSVDAPQLQRPLLTWLSFPGPWWPQQTAKSTDGHPSKNQTGAGPPAQMPSEGRGERTVPYKPPCSMKYRDDNNHLWRWGMWTEAIRELESQGFSYPRPYPNAQEIKESLSPAGQTYCGGFASPQPWPMASTPHLLE